MQFFKAVNRSSEYCSTLLFNIKTADAADRITERFRQLFERGDLTGMGEELYRGQVPSDDERLLQSFFGRAEQMQAELEQPAISVLGTSATADVRIVLDFRNRRTGERFTDVPYEFQLTFALDSSDWFLERVESR